MLDVISRVKNGDQKAFRELYDNYKNKVYFFCLKYVRSEEIASDILQETFIKIWDFRNNLEANSNFDGFIFKLVKNRIFNYISAEKVRKDHENEAQKLRMTVTNETENSVVYNDYKTLLTKAIKTMPEKRKKVYVLSRYSGYTYDEIAEKLNISPNTVEIHIGKALRDIRSFIKAYSNEELLFLIFLLFF